MMKRLRLLLRPGLYLYLARRFLGFLAQLVRDYALHRPLPGHRLTVASGAMLGRRVILGIAATVDDSDPARIEIGERAYIEDGAELGLVPGALLTVGRNTSIHRGCVILGNVKIGANCVFSYNIFVGTGTHIFDAHPLWLIKDQDDELLATRPHDTVWIDDDVWLGWGVYIRSGAHIGRGAVIGANAVVNSDVEPYAVYAGVPARKLRLRLDFSPPAGIDAANDESLPYFYSGFLDDQASLPESRRRGAIRLAGAARIVLRGQANGVAVIRGEVLEGAAGVRLDVSTGGGTVVEEKLAAGSFEIRVRLTAAKASDLVPPQLRRYTTIELDPGQDARRVMIKTVALREEN